MRTLRVGIAYATFRVDMLTSDQIAAFNERGLVRVEGLLPEESVRFAREAVRSRLAEVGLWLDGAWHLDAGPKPKWPNAGPTTKVIGRLAPVAALSEVAAVGGAADDLLGGRVVDRTVWKRPQGAVHLAECRRLVRSRSLAY